MRFAAVSKLGLVLAGMTFASAAQAVPLGTSLTIFAGGASATFNVTNCTLTGSSCIDFEMVQNGSSLGVTIQPKAPATTPLADYANNNSVTDMTFDLNITNINPLASRIAFYIAGSGDLSTAGLTVPGSNPTAYIGTPATYDFTLSNQFSGTFDVSAFNSQGPDASVTSLTADLAVPEPASIALFMLGVGVTAMLKRRRA